MIASEDQRTLAQLAREALQVQNACNLSGVVHGYARALSRLRTLLEATPERASTAQINEHPISQLWADKCASMAGVQSVTWDFRTAYERTTALAEVGT